MKDSVVILGAGIYQLGLIKKAQSLGYHVHAVSRPGNYPGLAVADESHPIDTTDKEGVLELCRRVHPLFVTTSGSDVCMPTIGYVNERLGLPGVKSRAAEVMSSKSKFRDFEKNCGIDGPTFFATHSPDEAWGWFSNCEEDVLLKPTISSGSRGISRVGKGIERAKFSELFNVASKDSISGEVCLETLLPGKEVGGNALLQDGKCVFIAISKKHLNGFLVAGHEYPTELSRECAGLVVAELENCVSKLDYTDGPLNFDVMVDGHKARIIELSARFGGNGLVDLCDIAYGVDLEMCMLKSLSGQPLCVNSSAPRPCGSFVFGAQVSGILRSMASIEDLRRQCPWIHKLMVQRHVGDRVDKMNSNADLIGYVTFSIPQGMEWDGCVEKIRQNLKIEI